MIAETPQQVAAFASPLLEVQALGGRRVLLDGIDGLRPSAPAEDAHGDRDGLARTVQHEERIQTEGSGEGGGGDG